MSLSSTSHADGRLPDRTASTEALSPGAVFSVEQLDLSSTGALTNLPLSVEIAFTVGAGADWPGPADPVSGWEGIYDGSASPEMEMPLLPGDSNDMAWGPSVISVRPSSTTDFSVFLGILVTQDFLDVVNDVDNFVNVNTQLERSTINSGTNFDVAIPSLFNQVREMLIRVSVLESGGRQEFIFRKRLRGSYWSRDIDGNLNTPLSNQSRQILVDNVPSPTLKTTGQNIIRWEVDVGFTPGALTQAAIWRADNFLDGTDIRNIRQYRVRMSNSLEILPSLDDDLIIDVTVPVLVSGTRYTGDIEIDPTKLAANTNYRIAVHLFQAGSPPSAPPGGAPSWYDIQAYQEGPAISGFILDIQVGVSNTPPPSTGALQSSMVTYDRNSKVWTTDCLSGLAPEERIQICATMDKPTYNTDVQSNGSTGTFNSNFRRVMAWASQSDPASINEIESLGMTLDSGSLIDQQQQLTACTIFRIPSDWAGDSGFFFLAFVFEYTGPESYKDYILVRFKVIVNSYINPAIPGGFIELSGFFDDQDNPVNPSVCDNSTEFIKVCFDLDDANPENYSFIPMIRLGSEETQNEFDGYSNNYLPLLESPFFISADPDFTGGTACAIIDSTLLQLGKEYCISAIAKGNNDAAPPDPDPVTCPTIEIITTAASDQSTAIELIIGLVVELNAALPALHELESISVSGQMILGGIEYDLTSFQLIYPNTEAFTVIMQVHNLNQQFYDVEFYLNVNISVLNTGTDELCNYGPVFPSIQMQVQAGVLSESSVVTSGIDP